MDTGHLIVGLGNPGAQYRGTRHNAGFLVVEALATRWKVAWTDEKKFSARVAQVRRNGRPVWLCQPQTFMNLSGEAVGAMMSFYQLPLAQLLVVVDDADLPLGGLRLRPSGSSGGHHGLESIEQRLGKQKRNHVLHQRTKRGAAVLGEGFENGIGDAGDFPVKCRDRKR